MGMNDFSLFFPFVRRSVFSRKRDPRSFLPFPLSNHTISFPPSISSFSPPLPPPLAATVRAPTYATTYTRGFSILHALPLYCVRTRMSFPEVGKGKDSYSGIIVSLLLSLFSPLHAAACFCAGRRGGLVFGSVWLARKEGKR